MGTHHVATGRTEHLWILAIAAIALAGSFVLRLSAEGNLVFPIPWLGLAIPLPQACFSRLIFGVSCPGCGLTRSFVAIGQGDVHSAFLLNPMGPAVYLLCLLQVPYRLAEYFGVGGSNARWTAIKGRMDLVIWAVLVGLLAQWLVGMM